MCSKQGILRSALTISPPQYSNKQAVTMPGEDGAEPSCRPPKERIPRPPPPGTDGRILLVTVTNVVYPITVEIVTAVFQPSGPLLKIVTFTKMGKVQVEA